MKVLLHREVQFYGSQKRYLLFEQELENRQPCRWMTSRLKWKLLLLNSCGCTVLIAEMRNSKRWIIGWTRLSWKLRLLEASRGSDHEFFFQLKRSSSLKDLLALGASES